MSEPKLNFNKMPEKLASNNNVEAGINDLFIVDAKPQLSKAGKQMLVVTVAPIAFPKFTIDDYYTLFGVKDEEGNYPVEEFGQFKLRTLQEVTNTIPEGDYTLALIGRMLKGKKFRAELVVEPYNGKDYLKVGYPESFEAYEETVQVAPETQVSNEVIEAIDTDDEL